MIRTLNKCVLYLILAFTAILALQAEKAHSEEACASSQDIIAYNYSEDNGDTIVIHAYVLPGPSAATLIVSNEPMTPTTIRGAEFCVDPRHSASQTEQLDPNGDDAFFFIDATWVSSNTLEFNRGYAQVYALNAGGIYVSRILTLNLASLW